ncbi:hypothetical protein V8E51_019193 [Hyaloscypha variabilis]
MSNPTRVKISMEEFLLQPLAQDGRPSFAASHASTIPTVAIPAQRNTYETLGKQGVIFVFFGSAAIVATLGFFVFLWFSTESNSIWKHIMLADWGVRAVTITAVLSRWLAATQAALATAMIAGLILHGQQVALSDSAPLSLMRVGYSGPWSLSLLLSLTRNRSAKFSLYGLALLLTLSTTLLQFTSTILLSDFTISLIQSEPQDMLLNYSYSNLSFLTTIRYSTAAGQQNENLWQTRPASYPTFAEYLDTAPVVTDGVDDSGVIIRSFFPLPSSASRSSLQSYIGVASVLGMRILCARPSTYEINLEPIHNTLDLEISMSTSEALSILDELAPFGVGTQNWTLVCSLPTPGQNYNSSEWTLSLCNNFDSQDTGVLVPTIGQDYFGGGYILFNVTGTVNSWARSIASNRWKNSTHGEWAKFASEDMSSQLDISICSTSFTQNNFNISASSTSNRTEPSIGWDIGEQKFDTLAIRRQLGATQEQLTLDNRGLSQLGMLENNASVDPGLRLGYPAQSWERFPSPSNNSLALCQFCVFDFTTYADIAQIAIFQDILQQTSHPALALQAYGTLLYSTFYYINAVQYDLNATVSVTNFVLRIQPTAYRGFILYSIIIVVHLTLILFITGLFLSSRRQTMLSNSWQAVAQIVSTETGPILEFADRATDSEISKWITKKRKDDSSFGIMEGDGGIRLRRCADQMD